MEQFDKPKAVYKHPGTLIFADFIGSPTINKLKGVVRFDKKSGVYIVHGDLFTLATGYKRGAGIKDRQEVMAAVRPESVLANMVKGHEESVNIFKAEISTVLPAGPETILQVKFKDYILDLLITQEVDYLVGEKINIYMPPKEVLLFDSSTGRLIPQLEHS